MKKSLKSVIAVMLVITLATSAAMFVLGYKIALAKQEAINTTEAYMNLDEYFDTSDSVPTTWDAGKYPKGAVPSYTDWNALGHVGIYPPSSVFQNVKGMLEPEVRASILNAYLENDNNFPLDNKDLLVLDWYDQQEWEDNNPTVPKKTEEPIEEPAVEEEVVEEEPVDAEPEYQVYVVQYGDSFWKIAKNFYGDGRVWQYIVDCNNWDRSRQALRVGTELKIYDLPDGGYDYVSNAIVSYSSSGTSSSNVSDQGCEFRKWSQDVVDNTDTSSMTYLGDYNITGYDPYCIHCNGKCDGITASGTSAIFDYSVAVKGLDFGTKIYIEGYGIYEVHDRPAREGIVDIACKSHDVCYDVTRRSVPVYIVE